MYPANFLANERFVFFKLSKIEESNLDKRNEKMTVPNLSNVVEKDIYMYFEN